MRKRKKRTKEEEEKKRRKNKIPVWVGMGKQGRGLVNKRNSRNGVPD